MLIKAIYSYYSTKYVRIYAFNFRLSDSINSLKSKFLSKSEEFQHKLEKNLKNAKTQKISKISNEYPKNY